MPFLAVNLYVLIKSNADIHIHDYISKTNLSLFFEASKMRAIIPGTNGSELLGTLLQFYDETNEAMELVAGWPEDTSDAGVYSREEFIIYLERHRKNTKLQMEKYGRGGPDRVTDQIKFYLVAEDLFMNWMFEVLSHCNDGASLPCIQDYLNPDLRWIFTISLGAIL